MGKLGYWLFPSLLREHDRLFANNLHLLTFLKARQDKCHDLEKMLAERSENLALKVMECERLKTQIAMLRLDQK